MTIIRRIVTRITIIHTKLNKLTVRNKKGESLGKIFRGAKKGDTCDGGAWANFGTGFPSLLVSGGPTRTQSVMLLTHELLNTLGIGHTQTRPGDNP